MANKNICPVHHYRYSGNRCPICENERINNMVRRFAPKETPVEEKVEEILNENLDWEDLADKFNIKGL
jgi:hypothetical protein